MSGWCVARWSDSNWAEERNPLKMDRIQNSEFLINNSRSWPGDADVWNLPDLDGAVLTGWGDDVVIVRAPRDIQDRTLVSRHQRLVRGYPTRLYRERMYNSKGQVHEGTLVSRHQRLVRGYPSRLYSERMYNSQGQGPEQDPFVPPPAAGPELSDPSIQRDNVQQSGKGSRTGPLCHATSGWSGAIRPALTERECTTVRDKVNDRALVSRHQRRVRDYPTRLYRERITTVRDRTQERTLVSRHQWLVWGAVTLDCHQLRIRIQTLIQKVSKLKGRIRFRKSRIGFRKGRIRSRKDDIWGQEYLYPIRIRNIVSGSGRSYSDTKHSGPTSGWRNKIY